MVVTNDQSPTHRLIGCVVSEEPTAFQAWRRCLINAPALSQKGPFARCHATMPNRQAEQRCPIGKPTAVDAGTRPGAVPTPVPPARPGVVARNVPPVGPTGKWRRRAMPRGDPVGNDRTHAAPAALSTDRDRRTDRGRGPGRPRRGQLRIARNLPFPRRVPPGRPHRPRIRDRRTVRGSREPPTSRPTRHHRRRTAALAPRRRRRRTILIPPHVLLPRSGKSRRCRSPKALDRLDAFGSVPIDEIGGEGFFPHVRKVGIEGRGDLLDAGDEDGGQRGPATLGSASLGVELLDLSRATEHARQALSTRKGAIGGFGEIDCRQRQLLRLWSKFPARFTPAHVRESPGGSSREVALRAICGRDPRRSAPLV